MDKTEIAEVVNDKKILITGGTGSLGKQILASLEEYSPREIVILSRDENKQYHLEQELKKKYKHKVSFELGDIRDLSRMMIVTQGVDIIIHAAALKHVPPSEKEPLEFIKTNILGTNNVIESAIKNEVPVFVSICTDKAVKPVNAYGMTKALQEKILIAASRRPSKTRFVNVRYGNVIGSRGSVIPLFQEKIRNGEILTITDPSMTRFLLRLEEAFNLIIYAIRNGKSGETYVKKMPSIQISELARIMGKAIAGKDDYPIKIVGIREGEKIHEVLVSEDEMRRATEFNEYYLISPFELVKQRGEGVAQEYSSFTTQRIREEEMIDLLKKEGFS